MSKAKAVSERARTLIVAYARAHQHLGAAVTIEEKHAAAVRCSEVGGALFDYVAELEGSGARAA